MTSKYAVEFAVPDDFPELLKEFTREVLRAVTYEEISGSEQEIYAFAALHFAKLAKSQTARFNKRKLMQAAMNMFRQADGDGSGDLDFAEVRQIVQNLANDLGLESGRQVADLTTAVMRAADDNGDGRLNYEEFAPVAVDIIESLYFKFQRQQSGASGNSRQTEEQVFESRSRLTAARLKAEGALVHDMSSAELKALILEIFQRADADGSGFLDAAEFGACLQDTQLGLSKTECDHLVQSVDFNRDGQIQFEEFAPVCFDLLVELTARQILEAEDATNASGENRARAEAMLSSMGRAEVETLLMNMFKKADTDGNGYLDMGELMTALESMNMGLTTSDIRKILNSISTTADGKVRYKAFAPLAFDLLATQLQVEIGDDAELREEAARRLYGDKSEADVRAMIGSVFSAADRDGSGGLSKEELYSCLIASGIDFKDNEIAEIIQSADVNNDGTVDLAEFTPVCYELALEVAIKELKASRAQAASSGGDKRAMAEKYLLEKMSRTQLEKTLEGIFAKADTDGSGQLGRAEFAQCLQDTGLGFADEEIEFVLAQCDTNQDGTISFEEFVPVCFDLLVDIMSKNM